MSPVLIRHRCGILFSWKCFEISATTVAIRLSMMGLFGPMGTVAIDQPACHSLHDSHLEDKIFSSQTWLSNFQCLVELGFQQGDNCSEGQPLQQPLTAADDQASHGGDPRWRRIPGRWGKGKTWSEPASWMLGDHHVKMFLKISEKYFRKQTSLQNLWSVHIGESGRMMVIQAFSSSVWIIKISFFIHHTPESVENTIWSKGKNHRDHYIISIKHFRLLFFSAQRCLATCLGMSQNKPGASNKINNTCQRAFCFNPQLHPSHNDPPLGLQLLRLECWTCLCTCIINKYVILYDNYMYSHCSTSQLVQSCWWFLCFPKVPKDPQRPPSRKNSP